MGQWDVFTIKNATLRFSYTFLAVFFIKMLFVIIFICFFEEVSTESGIGDLTLSEELHIDKTSIQIFASLNCSNQVLKRVTSFLKNH